MIPQALGYWISPPGRPQPASAMRFKRKSSEVSFRALKTSQDPGGGILGRESLDLHVKLFVKGSGAQIEIQDVPVSVKGFRA